uniref:Uncharacterized protein n=1 Tax=Euplotes crassus TaxID=5936 RepID=A0A7S3NZI5_EUPCR|eukprot:CAMPEP_0197001252 /NCGR_PEP_ID=MMETSP1380-20130617/5972_1 /TAXON_ID=5936 /ORGANISM="Euplotes crassus, Strain CT5" /LENGTH=317 /DNA_ID=CAMNT_0042418837 /DNA_START=12 /DNA_END=965 /DNA_ORIENTATION=-
MKTIAILSLIASVGLLYVAFAPQETSFDREFETFIATYGKNYGSTEEMSFRRLVFNANMQKAVELGKLNPLAKFGVTLFADQTEEEMAARMGAVDPGRSRANIEFHTDTSKTLDFLDWSGAMQPVQDQGSCGSCWAFSATAAFEGRHHIHMDDETEKYSEQEALDCSSSMYGCNGGWYEAVWDMVSKDEFCSLSSYKYTARKGSCQKTTCDKKALDTGYKFISKDEASMHDALKSGPISIAVDASTWSTYQGGILTRESCGTGMNHAVVIVAYNDEDNTWKVRNSWSPSWGEEGHIRLRYGENTCNLLYKPAYPTFD